VIKKSDFICNEDFEDFQMIFAMYADEQFLLSSHDVEVLTCLLIYCYDIE